MAIGVGHAGPMVERVPVLYLTGPVGVDKSSVVREAGRLLRDRGLAYAAVAMEWLGDSWPRPADDPWNGRVLFENLRVILSGRFPRSHGRKHL